MSWTLKEQECPHWGREGGLPIKRNFLGQDVVLGKYMVYSGEGEPIGPYK